MAKVSKERFAEVWREVYAEGHQGRIHEVARRVGMTYEATVNRSRYLKTHDGITLPRFDGGSNGRAKVVPDPTKANQPSDQKPGEDFREDGNDAIAEVRAFEITTLEQLLERCKVDRKVWEVERHVVNKWPVAMKMNGGKGKPQKVQKTELIQVKAWLKRIVPISTEIPPIRAAEIHIPKLPKAVIPKRSGGMKRWVILSDAQIGFRRDMRTGYLDPFHDRKAQDLALQVIRAVEADGIVDVGDGQDLANWTDKFVRSPEFVLTTQPAIDEESWWWAQRALAAPGSERHRIAGNHDERMMIAIQKHLPEAYNLRQAGQRVTGPQVLSIPYLLGLEHLGVEYHGPYPDGRVWLNDNLAVEHGDVIAGQTLGTVRKMLDTARNSIIIGHTHGVAEASKTEYPRGRKVTYSVWSIGTLARVDGSVPGRKARQNWQQAFAIVDVEPGNGLYDVHVVKIYGGAAVVNGVRFEGCDRSEEIARDTGWETMVDRTEKQAG
ncbi:hypothetical protein KQI63_15895 [bacterium]|nr:hypothetical protein [bacterium]